MDKMQFERPVLAVDISVSCLILRETYVITERRQVHGDRRGQGEHDDDS